MIIIDDFIKDETLLSKIQKDENFWKEGYRWWKGWWNSNSPMDTRHELIETIWRKHLEKVKRNTSIRFFRWSSIYCHLMKLK